MHRVLGSADRDVLFLRVGGALCTPEMCCKSVHQCSCFRWPTIDQRCALPCDDEVPIVCAMCCILCAGKPQIPEEEEAPPVQDEEPTTTCKVCLEQEIRCVLRPCGHACLCTDCRDRLAQEPDPKCPICRQPFQNVENIIIV